MIKFILGLTLSLIGAILIFILLAVGLNETKDTSTSIIVFIMSLPLFFLTWIGIKIMVKANKKMRNDENVTSISPEKILAKWEISGNEWDYYKEKKCSPESIQRFSLLAALFAGLTIGFLLSLIAIDSGLNSQLIIGSISAIIVFTLSFFSIKRKRKSFYGRLYHLKSADVILSYEYVDFCGKITPINTNTNRVTTIKVITENNFNTLTIYSRGMGMINRSFNIYEFPIPIEKTEEAKEIIKKMKN